MRSTTIQMRGKLMIIGFVLLAAGLALLVYSDPALNAVVIGQSTSTATTRAATSSLAGGFGGFVGGGGGFVITPGAGASAVTTPASRASSSTLSNNSIAENSAGFGLAAVGMILAVVGTRARQT